MALVQQLHTVPDIKDRSANVGFLVTSEGAHSGKARGDTAGGCFFDQAYIMFSSSRLPRLPSWTSLWKCHRRDTDQPGSLPRCSVLFCCRCTCRKCCATCQSLKFMRQVTFDDLITQDRQAWQQIASTSTFCQRW